MRHFVIVGILVIVTAILTYVGLDSVGLLPVEASAQAVSIDWLWNWQVVAISFLFCGINIFASAYFTALGNGRASAMISFIRTLVLQVAMILFLPRFFGIQGIWMALPVAELLTMGLTFWYFSQQQSLFKIRPTDW